MSDTPNKIKNEEANEKKYSVNSEAPSFPPSYDEVVGQDSGKAKEQSNEKNQYQDPSYNQNGKYGPNTPNGANNADYDVYKDPNVYVVPPQMVNITSANPQHLNPSYGEYNKNEEERWRRGDFPKPHGYFKHGAPLAPGKTNPSSGSGKGFPGRNGATYNNAARGG